jgi:hypothetical protein
MQANVGTADRIARLVGGAALVGAAAAGLIGPWGYAGVILLVTGAASRCPLYMPFGLSTCKTAQK